MKLCNFGSSGTLSGMRWLSRFRHSATSAKVAGSIPDGVTGIYYWVSPSGRIMGLESTQPTPAALKA